MAVGTPQSRFAGALRRAVRQAGAVSTPPDTPSATPPGSPSPAATGDVAGSPGPHWSPLPDIAEALRLGVTQVHQLLRERALVGVRRDGVLQVPAEFVQDGLVVKGLTGTVTLLTDAGYADAEIVDWLFAADDTLPGTPIAALRENRGREVHRRAQTAGF